MKGHIRKRGCKSYAIVLDIGRDLAGKRQQRWHSVKGSKRDAERELARLLNEVNTGSYIQQSKMTVGQYLRKWLEDSAKPTVSGKTFERYKQLIETHISPALGSRELTKLKSLDVSAFYSKSLATGRRDGKGGLSAQTVLHFHRVLHGACAQAVRWGLVARNPVDAVRPPRPPQREMKALDDAGIAVLLKTLDNTELYAPAFVAVATGLRRGELLALRWGVIDLDRGTLVVNQTLEQTKIGLNFKLPKTHRSRRAVILPSVVSSLLRQHRATQNQRRLKLGSAYVNNDLVFPRADGSPFPPDSFTTLFAAAVRRSGLQHIRFHDLRHTHATQMLKEGIHPKIVSERLGHSKISITLDTYSHVLSGMQEDAAQKIDVALRSAMGPKGD